MCRESTDNIIGILYTKDYFRVQDRSKEYLRREVIRPVSYVLETVSADVLFRNMKQKKDRFAVVIDEFGGTSGIITMNDLLKQIVGEFNDNILLSKDAIDIKSLNQGAWQVSGNASTEKVAAQIGLNLPIDKYDTMNDLYCSVKDHNQNNEDRIVLFKEYGFIMKNIQLIDDKLDQAVIVKID